MKNKALWMLVVVWGIACLCGSHGCREQERIALLALNATLDLIYWMDIEGSYFNCCSWEGVECNPTIGRVTQLRLSSLRYNRFGSNTWYLNASLLLPFKELKSLELSENYLGGLSQLEVLDLSSNFLDHYIISVLGTIPSIRHLFLQDSNLSGTLHVNEVLDLSSNFLNHIILSVLNTIPSLWHLFLQDSNLSGTLHVNGLCNLIKLEELDLCINGITGGLPTCWRNMTSIRILNLANNEFTDSVASSPLTSLASLEFLSISGNHFNIPSSLGPLANHSRLKVLLLDDTKLTVDTKVASLIPRFQLKVFTMSNSLSKGFKVTFLGCLNHQYDLRMMDLSSNDIPGPFPTWLLENNTKLEMLIMRNNSFTTLEVPSMTRFNVPVMDISNNDIRGGLTTEFCANFPYLDHLNLSANRLEENIPSELGSIKSLYSLDLSRNNFSRGLPSQLLDSNSSLIDLKVAYNKLQGAIVLSNHTMNLNLSRLHLGYNMFTGDLSFLSSIVNLKLLDISNNSFIGKLPRLIANMSYLVVLDLSKNHLDGLIPQELFNLGELMYLDLSYNNLSGSLASSFISHWLSHIHLNGNKLNGTLAHVLSESFNLVTLDLSENEFSGSIPYWLGNLSELSILSLRGNCFIGTFPEQLCSLKGLSMIDLSKNNLFGPLPSCLGPMNFDSGGCATKVTSTPYYRVDAIDLSPWRYFNGEIPQEIAILQDMLMLNLSHNKLNEHIPMSLWNLTKIESIDLSYNNLIGSIPEELTQLNSLEIFNVSYNDLSGAIPNKNQFGAFDESSYYGNHLLCGLPLSDDCSKTINVNCSATKSCMKAKEDGWFSKIVQWPNNLGSLVLHFWIMAGLCFFSCPLWFLCTF
ncbi:hypothetical protein EUGRSUZ_C04405 [Eucalyptus grandis]|uniref:Uncharacterized protein n=2 Tax=Eucalyptus grandis TaxID=71139 RepID=A0ACC3LKU4_EUCGR|nr:hypothetical protein EUGRSUZ_C04405 [Eucalyptus grandis]